MNTGAIALMGNNPLAATQNNLASMGALVGLNNAMNNFPGRKLPVYTVSSDKVNSGAGM